MVGSDLPVLVVGAGPVGLVLACELRRGGVAVRLIDRLAEPSPYSKAVAIHSRSMEMFRSMGIADRFAESGLHCTGVVLMSGGKTLAEVDFGDVETAFPYALCRPQDETERDLGEHLAELGGRIERGVECVGLTQTDDRVTATLRHGDGKPEEAEFAYVVGCDGGRSTVRELVGTTLEGSFAGTSFLLADCEAEHQLDRLRMIMVFHPDGLWALFPLPGKRCRLILQVAEKPEAGAEPTLEQLQRLTDERVGTRMRLYEPHWLTYFEIHHGQVPQYRFGRVFLAGDAAHIHSPAGGQGMNTGMQDAYNLGWKLALAWHGRAASDLLASYDAERHPVGADVVKLTTTLTQVATIQRPLARHARELGVWLLVGHTPLRAAGAKRVTEMTIAYRDSPIVGADLGGLRVRVGEFAPDSECRGGINLAETFAPERHTAVFFAGTMADTETCAVAARSLEARLGKLLKTVFVAGGDVQDLEAFDEVVAEAEGRAAERYGAKGPTLVLVRPDRYIAACGDARDALMIDQALALTFDRP